MAKFNKVQSQLRKKAFGGITGKIFGRIRSIFSGRPKAPPQPSGYNRIGHRGIAAGSLRERQQLQAEGKADQVSGNVKDAAENMKDAFHNAKQ